MTAKQLQLLRFICGYQRAHDGAIPSYVAMARGVGLRNKSGAHRLVSALIERGYLRRNHLRVGAPIEVLRPVPVPYAPDGAPLYAVAM